MLDYINNNFHSVYKTKSLNNINPKNNVTVNLNIELYLKF